MAEKRELPPSDREATASRQERGDPLTEAQSVIAQLLVSPLTKLAMNSAWLL
jgi:hypothetical protein